MRKMSPLIVLLLYVSAVYSVDDVMRRWRSIRDQYRRKRQQRSKSGSSAPTKRKTQSNLTDRETASNSEAIIDPVGGGEEVAGPSSDGPCSIPQASQAPGPDQAAGPQPAPDPPAAAAGPSVEEAANSSSPTVPLVGSPQPAAISRRGRRQRDITASDTHSHSLRYYYTTVTAPGSGLPEFSIVGYVDDREIVNYNSESGRCRPKVQWMEKVEDGYWEEETQTGKQLEALYKHNVRTAMSRFSQSGGFHSFQVMYGCERRDDGSITGYDQYGYDGREFMALDTHTWTYVPTMMQAQITTQRWNSPEVQVGERNKNYLENICIEWLQKYVEKGREDLERRVRPQVKVSGQQKGDAMKLHCQVYGFHPRPVDVKWMKNDEDEVHSYETTHVLPNPDGTYQIRVSAEVTPKDGDSYSCYVDHSSLEEPLNIVWEPDERRLRLPFLQTMKDLTFHLSRLLFHFV